MHVNNTSLILLILQVDYIGMLTEMKPKKSCLRVRTMTVMTERQRINF